MMQEMEKELRDLCRKLLQEETVKVVIGYAQTTPGMPAHPVFVTDPAKVDHLVWNNQCFFNLATYVTRKDIRALGKAAIVVKGCDEKALVVLEQESQIQRSDFFVIGMCCEGVGDPVLGKCASCDVHVPRFADAVIGASHTAPSVDRYAALDEFMKLSREERMAFWREEFSRCIKCYACRQACPVCYCNRCIVDKNRPIAFDTSATLKGNFAWHIVRAFHEAGRCIGCGECERACPAGIRLGLLNLALARSAETHFEYRAGMDPETPPIIGSYSLEDKENFIK